VLGIAGVCTATPSIPITIVAAVLTVTLAVLVLSPAASPAWGWAASRRPSKQSPKNLEVGFAR
jgi:hypothetical protein